MKITKKLISVLYSEFKKTNISNQEPLTPSEQILVKNKNWPYQINGVFVIADAGGYDGDYPTWAAGTLEVNGENDFIGIDIDGTVVKDAEINIDSGHRYEVLIDAPVEEFSSLTFPIIKIIK